MTQDVQVARGPNESLPELPLPADAVPPARFSPEQLSTLLGEKNVPTPEQSGIISSPLTPRLVIAGAGSGKTATMADRVVWLVANGWVRPEEVLGVTFTRKAAGELASRIRAKLTALQRLAARSAGTHVFPEGMFSSDSLEPKVSTYHSFASGIVSDYGLRLGVERDVVLLGGAQAWQLASEVVEAYDGEYGHFRAAKSTLVKAVIQLAGECAEHLQEPEDVEAWLMARLSDYGALPYLAGKMKNPPQAAAEIAGMLRTRASVADMVGRYSAAKRARGALDFGDLVALAARVASDVPLAARMERQRYKVVLLDEFQDTSYAQLVLFSRLFGGGHAVTAVGDPNQSIYGFRGASAGQLFHFVQEFPVRTATPDGTAAWKPAPTSYLTTAWRNGKSILAAANVMSESLAAAEARRGPAGTGGTAAASVPPLQPSPHAVDGRVVLGRFASDVEEAAALADDVLKYRVTDFDVKPDGTHVAPALACLELAADGFHLGTPPVRGTRHRLRNCRAGRLAGYPGSGGPGGNPAGARGSRPVRCPDAPACRSPVADRTSGPDGVEGLVQPPCPAARTGRRHAGGGGRRRRGRTGRSDRVRPDRRRQPGGGPRLASP